MSEYERDLAEIVQKKHLIPFIGAGFSIACGLPSWRELIEHLLEAFNTDLTDIQDGTDFLQIAEYLKILNDGKIGPIRFEMQKFFNEHAVDISKSDSHLHLISLDTPLVYTTNYDNLIENAFDYVKRAYFKIVTTEDILKQRTAEFPQIIKFHGSFEHEETMVLTESDYFKRLEFESPIDIKLRSDILGKSILFIGYSFSDFNIRYLWFKLRRMMKAIDEKDIPRSFIILQTKDKMMHTLFRNIGISPIYLEDYRGSSINEKLSDFLERLVIETNKNSEWPFDMPVIATDTQIENMIHAIENNDTILASTYLWLLNNSHFGENQLKLFKEGRLEIIDDVGGIWFTLMQKTSVEIRRELAKFLLLLGDKYNISCYNIIIISFLRYREIRDVIIDKNYPYINDLMLKKKLSERAESQMLLDALFWVKFSQDLKKDTTLYFLSFISSYFHDRINEVILNPFYDSESNHFPKQSCDITPRKIIDIMKTNVPWIPDPEVFDTHEFDRICEACGCTLLLPDEFDWNQLQRVDDVVNKLFS